MPTLSALLAAVAAGLAVALLLPGAAPGRGPRSDRSLLRGPWPVGLAGALTVGLLAEGRLLVVGLVVVGVLTGGWALLGRRREHRRALARAARLVEMCEALSSELRAGQPPGLALRHACADWAELAPAVAAAELGADVPDALRRVSRTPGLRGLAELAGGWQVSSASGATLSTAVSRVAGSARRDQATARLVASELAGARATAVLLALLPLAVLAMGSGLGGDPVGFLLSTPVGLACFAGGAALSLLGLFWIERVAAGAAS